MCPIFIDNKECLFGWIEAAKQKTLFQVAQIPLKEAQSWIYGRDHISHKSQGYFKVVACQSTTNLKIAQPLLEQTEVGLLGNIVCKHKDKKWILIQLKAEPGNLEILQMTCSVQATRSNLRQRHGGSRPPYGEHFNPQRAHILSHSHESEQGSRFLGKWNACWTIELKDHTDIGPLGPLYRWVSVNLIAELIDTDYLFTTDFRTVLFRCPWEKIFINMQKNTVSNTAFLQSLRLSNYSDAELKIITGGLRKDQHPQYISFHELDEWSLDETGIVPRNSGANFSVKHFCVQISGREVPVWDQPLIQSAGTGKVILLCKISKSGLEFLLTPKDEIGYIRRRQLSTPFVSEPGAQGIALEWSNILQKSSIMHCCRQVEEGGRFYQEINRFEVRLVAQEDSITQSGLWLTLADIKKLSGIINSETRSAFSLLVKNFQDIYNA